MSFFGIGKKLIAMPASATVDINQYVAAEKKAAEDIARSLLEQKVTFTEIKNAEKVFRKADKIIGVAADKKANIQRKYEKMIVAASKSGDVSEERALKREMYWRIGSVSAKTYKKLLRLTNRVASLSSLEREFDGTNEKIMSELQALSSGLRQEVVAEERAA